MPPDLDRLVAFVASLKHWSVYKAIALYAVLSLGAIQLATSTFPILSIPIWGTRLVIGLVVVGFPIVLLAAYALMTPRGRRRVFAVVLTMVALAVGGLILFRWMWDDRIVAVLPFTDSGGRDDSVLFADGIHDDLLSSLASLEDLNVISRASVINYRGRHGVPLAEIGKKFGASHILEGTISWSKDRAYVSMLLLDVARDQVIWGDHYEPSPAEFLGLREKLASIIAAKLRDPLTGQEQGRLINKSTQDLEAWILYRRGRAAQVRPEMSEKNYREAMGFFKQATERDPAFALAWARLSFMQTQLYQFFEPKNAELLATARKNADQAVTRNPDCAEAYIASARCAQLERKDSVVKRDLAAAVKLVPKDAAIRVAAAVTQQQLGWEREAAKNYEHAYRLSRWDPGLLFNYGYTLYESNQASKARDLLDTALRLQPDSVLFRTLYAAAEISWRGDFEQANNVLAGLPPKEKLKDPEGRATSAHCTLAILKGDFNGALEKLKEYQGSTLATVDSFGLGQQDYPIEAEGTILLYKGEVDRARECFQQVLWKYETAVWEAPESPIDLAQRALLYAWLGWKDAALADTAAARAKEKNIPEAGPLRRGLILGLAKTYAWAGDADRALEQIDQFIALPPSGYSYHNFRLDPAWLPLRNNPGFQQKLEILKRRLK